MANLNTLAIAVDEAIDALEVAVSAYRAEAQARDSLSRPQNFGRSHPLFESASIGHFVAGAIASKTGLVAVLKIMPQSPPMTVASQHPPEEVP